MWDCGDTSLVILSGLSFQTAATGCSCYLTTAHPCSDCAVTGWPQSRELSALHYSHSKHSSHQSVLILQVISVVLLSSHKCVNISLFIIFIHFKLTFQVDVNPYFKNVDFLVTILTDLVSHDYFFPLNTSDEKPFSWGPFVCVISINFNLQFLCRNLLNNLSIFLWGWI